MKSLLPLLFFFQIAHGQEDRPWVRKSTSGYNDTIYHTVIGVYSRPVEERTWIYRYALDSVPHEVIAPKVILQIDSHRLVSSSPDLFTSSPIIVGMGTWDNSPPKIGSGRKTHLRHSKKRKRRFKYTWTSVPGTLKKPRMRIKIFWGTKMPSGELVEVTDFNGTFKQWDSIGREYILHKKYFQ
jgi:hypothetical protein